MRKVSNKGFTLVELIIVITILAILATIAFISFQGYSTQARDTKKKSDIGNMVKSVELKSTEGVSLMSFVSGTGSQQPTISDTKVAGTGATSSDYKAGDVDLTVLGAPENFIPADNEKYQMGVTKKAGGKYQFATNMEENQVAYVIGTFQARDTSTGSLGYFYIGDTVTAGTLTGVISKISSDLETIYTNTIPTGTGVTNVKLAVSDSKSLIFNSGAEVLDGLNTLAKQK